MKDATKPSASSSKAIPSTEDEIFDELAALPKLPKLVVFDLDLTLWQCDGAWIDSCAGAPFAAASTQRAQRDGSTRTERTALDADGKPCHLFEDVRLIFRVLLRLQAHKTQQQQASGGGDGGGVLHMAVASRTGSIDWARELLDVLEITSHFQHIEIYPTPKPKHFAAILARMHAAGHRAAHSDAVFFDDEQRNIVDCGKIGVHAKLVHHRRGVTLEDFVSSMRAFATAP